MLGAGLGALQQYVLDQAVPVADNPTVFDQAVQQYPLLGGLDLKYKESKGKGGSNLLEFWPAGEPGDETYKRPTELPLDKHGVEVFSDKVRPIDILGDVVSHHLRDADPEIAKVYSAFEKSLSPEQEMRLHMQYAHALKNEGETRPFETWKETVGLPAYFRGYAFQQWPDDFNQIAYSPQQRAMFDRMMRYLQSPRK